MGFVELWATGGGEARWAASRNPRGMQIERIRYSDGRTTVAQLEAVENFSSFSFGPAGVVAAALTASSAGRPALMRSVVPGSGGATHRGHGSYRAAEVRVGWSADGAEWGWQSAAEAFGIDPLSEVSVELAVGSDFVLARVQSMGRPAKALIGRTSGFSPAFLEPQWFIAQVPSWWPVDDGAR